MTRPGLLTLVALFASVASCADENEPVGQPRDATEASAVDSRGGTAGSEDSGVGDRDGGGSTDGQVFDAAATTDAPGGDTGVPDARGVVETDGAVADRDSAVADGAPVGAPTFSAAESICTLPGGSSAEGPVWSAARKVLVVSSWTAPAHLYTCDPATKELAPFRMDTYATTSNDFDKDGHLLSIEQGIAGMNGSPRLGARLLRTKAPGIQADFDVVFDRFPGTSSGTPPAGRFNRPNDMVVKADGTIYFTDPDYGTCCSNQDLKDWQGVYRVSLDLKTITHEAKILSTPNGIAPWVS